MTLGTVILVGKIIVAVIQAVAAVAPLIIELIQ